MASSARRFRRDERGFVLVFVAIAIPALLGLAGLAVDGGRLLTLDTRLAALADSAALAAANRLDRSPGAIAGARGAALAMAEAVARRDGDPGPVSLSFRFAAELSDLRASPGFTLSDDAGQDAAFVEVATAPRSLVAGFLSLLGGSRVTIVRRAVASSQYFACDVTPLLFCHVDPDAFAARLRPGRQLLLRLDPTGRNGSVGWVGPADDPGGRQGAVLLASDAPAFCYGEGTTLRRNVAAADFDDAVNVRFDRYVGTRGPIMPELAAFPPAPSIVQGRRYQSCTSPPGGGDVNPPFHLPRDAGLRTPGPSTPYDAGQGDWTTSALYGGSGVLERGTALDEYLAWNHGNKSPLFEDQLRSAPTRYELYLRELGLTSDTETVRVPTRGGLAAAGTLPTGGPLSGLYDGQRESVVPRCYVGARAADQARRRIVYMAIADCNAERFTAGRLSRNVGKFFLTEGSSSGALLVEFVNLVRPGQDDGKLRHVVTLVDAR